MYLRLLNLLREHLAFTLKCASVLFLLVVSMLIVSCGSSGAAQVPGTPAVTVTINLDQNFASPTPALAAYTCGAWATVTSPGYGPNATVGVYAKFVQNISGNPLGMGNAHATAIVYWPNGTNQNINAVTTSDGLAVFQVPLQAQAVNHIVRVEVDFTSADNQHTCNVVGDEMAYFTPIYASPTAAKSPTPSNQPSAVPSDTPQPMPSGTPSTSPTGTPTVGPFKPRP